MDRDELIKELINCDISNNSYGNGKIKNVLIDNYNIKLEIEFKEKHSIFLMSKIIDNPNFIIPDKYKTKMKELLSSIVKPVVIKETPVNEIKTIPTHKEVVHKIIQKNSYDLLKSSPYYSYIQQLSQKIIDRKIIAIDLIDFFDDEDFENDLLKYTFSVFNKKNILLIDRAICLVGLTYIAMKYYENNYYDVLLNLYKKYIKNDDITINGIRNKFRSIVSYFRDNKLVDYYFDKETHNSYLSVPICECTVPSARLFDLFKLSYSIYKKKLLYVDDVCDTELNRKIKNAFLSLKNKDLLGNDDEPIKGTEYLLSKFTQSAIFTNIGFDELIDITSRCLKYLINYLKKEDEIYLIPPYFKNGFKKWKTYFEKNPYEREEYNKNRKFSNPIFRFRNRKLYLITAKYNIDEDIDINDININIFTGNKDIPDNVIPVNKNENLIFNDDEMGGYTLQPMQIIIDCDALNYLRYTITSKGENIYDSDEKMYRKNIFFDDYGVEVFPENDHVGELTIIHKLDLMSRYKISEQNILNNFLKYSFLYVELNKKYLIDGNYYTFTKNEIPQLEGECFDYVQLKPADSKKIYKVYRSVELYFNTAVKKENLFVVVDGQQFNITDDKFNLEYYIKDYTDMNCYKISLNWLTNGMHCINLIAADDIFINENKYYFILDKEFTIIDNDIDSSIKRIQLNSSFLDAKKTIEFDAGKVKHEINGIFIDKLKYCTLEIYSPFLSYSLNKKEWKFINGPLTYLNINMNSCMYLCGLFGYKGLYISSVDDTDINKSNQISCYPTNENNQIYKIDLKDFSQKKFKKMMMYFDLGYKRDYLEMNYYPDIGTELEDVNGSAYKLYTLIDSDANFKISVQGESTKKLFVNEIFTRELIKILDYIPKEDKSLIVNIYAQNKGTFLKTFEEKPFYTEHILVDRFKIINKDIKILDNKVQCTIDFIGTKFSKFQLLGSKYDYRFKEMAINSGEKVLINLNDYYYDFFSIAIGGKNSTYNKSFKKIIFDNIINKKQFIREKFKIISYIDTNKKEYPLNEIMMINQPIKINGDFGYLCNVLYNNKWLNIRIIILQEIDNKYLCRIFPDRGIMVTLPNNIIVEYLTIERMN